MSVRVTIADSVAEIALARASAGNALSVGMISELDAAITSAVHSGDVAAVLLYGEGKHFCVGADLRDVASMTRQGALAEEYVGCSRELARCPLPVVCAVEGYALGGGCEMVEMADIVIAAENSHLGHPELTMGTMPGAGGVQRLIRAAGKATAMDLLLCGRFLTASEALHCGLVSRVCAPGQALDVAREVALTVASRPRETTRFIKSAAGAAFEQPLSEGLLIERHLFHKTLETIDLRERVGAFPASRRSNG